MYKKLQIVGLKLWQSGRKQTQEHPGSNPDIGIFSGNALRPVLLQP